MVPWSIFHSKFWTGNALFFLVHLVWASGATANCFRSLDILPDATIPEFSVAGLTSSLGGRSCAAVEAERTAIFVDQLAAISEGSFASFSAWSEARDVLVRHIADTRERMEQARRDGASAQDWNALKTLSTQALGAGLTILGCPTTLTGLGGIACVGGLSLAAYGTYDGLSATGFQDRADEISRSLLDLEMLLRAQEDVGRAILAERQQAYLQRFETLCSVVQEHCQ